MEGLFQADRYFGHYSIIRALRSSAEILYIFQSHIARGILACGKNCMMNYLKAFEWLSYKLYLFYHPSQLADLCVFFVVFFYNEIDIFES